MVQIEPSQVYSAAVFSLPDIFCNKNKTGLLNVNEKPKWNHSNATFSSFHPGSLRFWRHAVGQTGVKCNQNLTCVTEVLQSWKNNFAD